MLEALSDGFEDIATHNLVTFESYQEPLDAWCLQELMGHYVNYRKQVSPSLKDLLPETEFKLFAVCVRVPQFLPAMASVRRVQPGVYDVEALGKVIRVLVVHELQQRTGNALLMLFSARLDLIRYGIEHFRQRSRETSTLLWRFLQQYELEGALMPTALEELKQFAKETIDMILSEMSPEERLNGVPLEERLKGLTPDELLGALPQDVRKARIKKAELFPHEFQHAPAMCHDLATRRTSPRRSSNSLACSSSGM